MNRRKFIKNAVVGMASIPAVLEASSHVAENINKPNPDWSNAEYEMEFMEFRLVKYSPIDGALLEVTDLTEQDFINLAIPSYIKHPLKPPNST